MHNEITFIYISIFLYSLGIVPYTYHIFSGKVTPHPFTWTTGFLFALVNLYLIFMTVGFNGAMMPVVVRILFLGIIAGSGWYMIKKIEISNMDKLIFVLALSLFLISLVLGPTYAVITMAIITTLSNWPTFKKVWKNPYSEDALVRFTGALSVACLLYSLPIITFENSFVWIYSIFFNTSMGIFIRIRSLYGPRTILMHIYQVEHQVAQHLDHVFHRHHPVE